ncbi:Fur family transcriptional regulator [Fischerella sp. NIES-3754]|uniref:Fur family transcriptional regulator n=1 Tax=Fischerella sp. NIES-3754 TaxID=1752063 RepID=UPI00071F13A5|nr:Fur family transcriptional regulator [Fischerella sp. NIES-3754]BAU08408.1 putative ferric uptake regulatory protein [Fischerella sp. NIES-3754]BCX10780.1 MAG: transcriptional repressor [Fischerella sp.]
MSIVKTGLTPHQQSILKFLEKLDSPISAQNLYVQLRSTNQRIGLATVYRALEVLKLRGLVQSRTATNGESLYATVHQHQHYLTCMQCGQSIAVDSCPIRELETQLCQSLSFKVYYHTLEFFGLCAPCQLEVPQ